MPSWSTFEAANSELAAKVRARFERRIAYLSTVRRDGSPRVFPVSPFFGDGVMWLFVGGTSPKRFDLRNDGRFALHGAVEDTHGGAGEAHISGMAIEVTDSDTYQLAVDAWPHNPPRPDYLLFELQLESVSFKTYGSHGEGVFEKWEAEG